MKTIPLTQGQFALVDDEDYDFLMQRKWCALKCGKQFYAVSHESRVNNPKRKHIRMNRLLMKTPDDLVCDHIDRNPLNNQKINLRNCTMKDNSRNKSAVGGSSKYIGVRSCYGKKRIDGTAPRYWRVTIRIGNYRKSLGFFPYTPEGEILAAKARDVASKEIYGEFANLNFP